MNHLKSPITVNFETTYHCNANCMFCSINNNEKQQFASLSQMKKLIDILSDNDVLRLNLFGGEPFVYPHILDIIKYAHKKGMLITGVSNGIAITEELCIEMKGYLNGLGISVHGIGELHEELLGKKNSFSSAINALKWLDKYNIPTSINMTVTALNYNKIIDVVKNIKEKVDIKSVALNRFVPNDTLDKETNNKLMLTLDMIKSTLNDLKYLENIYPDIKCSYAIHFPFCIIKDKSLRKYIGDGCGFGQSYCAINYNGDMKMCSYTGTVLGNILKEPLKDIWENNTLLKEYRSEQWMPTDCNSCNENLCKGGCKISCGKTFGIDPLFKWRNLDEK